MLIRREGVADLDAVRRVTAASYDRGAGTPPEVDVLEGLRRCSAWIDALSFVATNLAGGIVGHVVCSLAHVGSTPVLALGPISVHPDHQRVGVGSALVHTAPGAADALGYQAVVLLGDPAYYSRFGFELAEERGIVPPVAAWWAHLQVRTLTAHEPFLRGRFSFAEPLDVSRGT